MKPTLRFLLFACVFAYCAYFFRAGLHAGLTHDDLMNTYRAWTAPWSEILVDNLFFLRYSPQLRPFPALILKGWFELAPFDPFPLRVICLSVLFINAILAGLVARRLTGSDWVAGLAALLYAYHRQWLTLYLSSGFIYDVFCSFFYLLALLMYFREGWKGKAVAALLYVCALNSKEIAVSFPVTILVYELLRMPPWKAKQLVWAGIYGAMTVPYIVFRVLSPQGIGSVDRYAVEPNAKLYFEQLSRFLQLLWGMRESGYWVWLVPIGLLLLAHKFRERLIVWGLVTFAIGILPVALITQRDLDAVYVPLAMVAIGVAALVMKPFQNSMKASAVVFVVCLVALARAQRIPLPDANYRAEDRLIRQVKSATERMYEKTGTQATLVVENDAFTQSIWSTVFLSQFTQRNPSLRVFLSNKIADPAERMRLRAQADYLVNWNGNDWILTPQSLR